MSVPSIDVAMILAAGRGERLRPLTDHTPKPLVRVAGAALIDHHLRALAAAGIRRVVVNLHHLGDSIRAHLDVTDRYGMDLAISEEETPLETAGGLHRALPLLGDAPFLVVNADVYCDFDLARLRAGPAGALAHLVMVPCPPWRTHGDFDLASGGPGDVGPGVRAPLAHGDAARLTYTGLGVYDPAFLAGLSPGPMPLRPLMDAAITAGRLTGERHDGIWEDIGTSERLADARGRHGA